MKVMVAVKRVVDPDVVPDPVLKDGRLTVSGPATVNPFCETALEAAIQLKEKGTATEVVAVSAGEAECQEQLRTALALGADRAVHLAAGGDLSPLMVAKALLHIYNRETPDLLLFGRLGVGEDFGQTGPMVAALAGIPVATAVTSLDLEGTAVTVTRDVGAGSQTLGLELPAALTVDLRLAEPRYATMPMIMRARTKPIETVDLAGLDIKSGQTQRVLAVNEPVHQRKQHLFQDLDELVDFLTETGGAA